DISKWQGKVNDLAGRLGGRFVPGWLRGAYNAATGALANAQSGLQRAQQNITTATDNLANYAQSRVTAVQNLADKQKQNADAIARRAADQLSLKKIVDSLDPLRTQAGQLSDALQAARKVVADKQRLVDEAILKL